MIPKVEDIYFLDSYIISHSHRPKKKTAVFVAVPCKCFFSMLRWPTANGTGKCIYLSLSCAFNRGSLWMNKTPLLYKRKVAHYPAVLGGLTLCLICTLGDLRINSGGRKGLFSQSSHFSPHREACCSRGFCPLPSFPSSCCSSVALFRSLCCLICWQLSGIYYASISEAI